MPRISCVTILAITASLFAAGCEKAGQAPPPATEMNTPEEVFNRYCAACHGPGGNGAGSRPGPRLNGKEFIYGRSPEAVRESIKNGRGKKMPGFGDILPAKTLDMVVDYVLRLSA